MKLERTVGDGIMYITVALVEFISRYHMIGFIVTHHPHAEGIKTGDHSND